MNRFYLPLLILLAVAGFSCEEETFEPGDSFLQIYDDNNYLASYQPVAVSASEERYYLLSERSLTTTDFAGITIVTVDNEGFFEVESPLEPQYVAPTNQLVSINGVQYFFCLNSGNLRTQIVGVSNEGELIGPTPISTNAYYPLACSPSGNNNLLLLSYNPDAKTSMLTELNTDGQVLQQQAYSIGPGDDVLEKVINHFTTRSEKLPFFCGQSANGSYYFNGFYNYTLSLVFTNFGDEPTGVLQGQADDAGVKGLLSFGANDYAMVGFQFSDNFVQPKVSVSPNETVSSVSYFDRNIPELTETSKVKMLDLDMDGTGVTVIASETEGRQVVLYFYDQTNGDLLATKYLGSLNPFTLAGLIQTDDGGMAIAGTTFLAGRFERIYLQKLSKAELQTLL